jgi:hypothetical protein
MTREARLLSGIILITVPTIQYGGYFLLTRATAGMALSWYNHPPLMS